MREEAAIHSAIRQFVVGNFLLTADEQLDGDTLLMETGILDSTGAIELVAFLEEHFDIEIDEDEVIPENLNTINLLCAFVKRKMG